MVATESRRPQFGDPEIVAERAQFYLEGFAGDVQGAGAAEFLKNFCVANLARAHKLGRKAQVECGQDDRALTRLAGRLKYIQAHLKLAQCYGEQIAIMSEHRQFRQQALTYVALAYAELEALEYFDPARV